MHYYTNQIKDESLDFKWGLSCTKDKVKLPYPTCAMELVQSKSDRNGARNVDHIATCLKNGTVLIIPLSSKDGKDNYHSDDRKTLLFEPHREDPIESVNVKNSISQGRSSCIRYTQGFTAGNVQMKHWGHSSDHTKSEDQDQLRSLKGEPLLFHAWASGSIDCHVCELS